MQINEIIQPGLSAAITNEVNWKNVGKSLAQSTLELPVRALGSRVGVNLLDPDKPMPRAINKPAAAGATTPAQTAADANDSGSLDVKVQPGHRIILQHPVTKGVYFKTQSGWTNELGQPIINAETVAKLEQLIDAGIGREEPIPTGPITGKRIKGATRAR